MRRFVSIPVLSLSLVLAGCAEHDAPGSAPDPVAEGATQETAASIVQRHIAAAGGNKLRVTLASGDVETRFLDAKSLLEVKRVGEGTKEGKTETWTTYFTDYKPVNGIQVNHGIETEYGGETTRYIVTEVSYDQPVDAAMFRLSAPGT